MASGQIVIKLNKKKFEPLLHQLGMKIPSQSDSELVGKCVYQMFHNTHIPVDCMAGKTFFEKVVEQSGATSPEELMFCLNSSYKKFQKDGTPIRKQECTLKKGFSKKVTLEMDPKVLDIMEELKDKTGWNPSTEDALLMNAFFVRNFLTKPYKNGKTQSELFYEFLGVSGEKMVGDFMKEFLKWKNLK